MLPFEFVVLGTPISQQANGNSKQRWKARVRTSATTNWPNGIPPLTCNIRMKIVYYYDGTALDTDNMLKPIQDSLNGLVYIDDRQITDITAGKRDLNGSYRVRGLSPSLAEGFASNGEFVHIIIEEAPDFQELIR